MTVTLLGNVGRVHHGDLVVSLLEIHLEEDLAALHLGSEIYPVSPVIPRWCVYHTM